ncbi:hypothetical protein [Saccharomonospora xinjiangensis]|uniref:Uncharacterized protein n=1 Tax=Saccharomonospora xinjiangensis XJ-54 TaxID=882086 RepID=I0V3G9_9PSEU|nr:hypothetical protein [Saccharomonospora xinjiangensis]EID54672.1 hypothetical protein SacxiDRAFT_2448 [Saccharomonospora xinjiangensis XJ-54]
MTEKSIADALNVQAYDESTSANVDRAISHVPVAGTIYDSAKSISAHAQQAAQADNAQELASAGAALAGDGASFVASAAGDVVTFAMDPIGWLVSHGLNMLLELVQPLQDALHQVSGDGPAIGHASDNFVTIAQGFVALAEDFEKKGDTALAEWADEAGNAAKEALGDFSAGIRGIGSAAGSVAEVLQMWSMVMVVIEEVIKAIITELVSWLITIWLPALASSVISFGGSVAAAMTASIAKAASVLAKVTRYLGKFGKLLDDFMEYLVKMSKEMEVFTRKFRVGLMPGETKFGVGQAAQGFQPSNRVLTTMFGTSVGVKPFVVGAGTKAGIGAGKSIYGEGTEDVSLGGDEPWFDKSEIGGNQSPEQTRRNLDI